MSAPRVSVVMPVHNGMPYLDESVRAILAQSFADFEFVIGDDGSDDGSAELLAVWAARDPRIRLLRRERRSGLAAAGNWVVVAARAPLVAVAHADDLSHPDRLRRQVELFEARADAVLAGTLWAGMDEEGRQVRTADPWSLVRQSAFAPFLHSSIMFRKAAFEAVGGYRVAAEYWEDLDLYLRMTDVGRVYVLTETLARVRHSRISARLRNEQVRVEDAVDLMYRAVAIYRAGGDYSGLLETRPRRARLHPKTFTACGSTLLWSGRRPATARRMLGRARFRPDFATLYSLAWVLWGSVSPKSLRAVLRTVISLRGRLARRRLRGRLWVEWRPRGRAPGG